MDDLDEIYVNVFIMSVIWYCTITIDNHMIRCVCVWCVLSLNKHMYRAHVDSSFDDISIAHHSCICLIYLQQMRTIPIFRCRTTPRPEHTDWGCITVSSKDVFACDF